VVTSAHRDGTYDVTYLSVKSKTAGDEDDEDGGGGEKKVGVYTADSFPVFSSKAPLTGYVDTGVPQHYVTTVRERRTNLKDEADLAFCIDAGGAGGGRFVYTYSDRSLAREKRPWRMAYGRSNKEVQGVAMLLRGGDNGDGDHDDDDDDSDVGDVDDFIRSTMLGRARREDQREDKFTPVEFQAYVPIDHLK
jgi:hypothetical protein